MRRSTPAWVVFGLCVALVVACMAWVTRAMRAADLAGALAAYEARKEESARLALWRMDSEVSGVVARESALPYFAYAAFSPAEGTYTRMFAPVRTGDALVPSPLLTEESPYALLYFQVGPDGEVTSPQVPTGTMRELAEASYTNDERIEGAARRLEDLRSVLDREALLAAMFEGQPPAAPRPRTLTRAQPAAGEAGQQVARSVRGPEGRAGPTVAAEAEEQAPPTQSLRQAGPSVAAGTEGERPRSRQERQRRAGVTVAAEGEGEAAPSQFLSQAGPTVAGEAEEEVLRRRQERQRRAGVTVAAEGEGQAAPSQFLSQAGPTVAGEAEGEVLRRPQERQRRAGPTVGTEGEGEAAPSQFLSQAGPTVPVQPKGQIARSAQEFDRRAGQFQKAAVSRYAAPFRVSGAGEVTVGPFGPLWMDGALLLVRSVAAGGEQYVQGCVLDWVRLREQLLGEARDLLPDAELVPVPEAGGRDRGRMLASLPVRLEPGERVGSDMPPEGAGVRWSLLLAWGFVLLAMGVAGLLVHGALALGERRAAFVSAVTHELRTPLTTFRMYTEMLAERMVPDKARRAEYLETLRVEAERLSHLVENVLAYARLERGRAAGAPEDVALADLLGRMVGRLAERAARTGMELVGPGAGAVPDVRLRADASAVEQILANLVDNACKYAAGAEDRRIELTATVGGRDAALAVRDHGPGVAAGEARRVFRAFRKSAQEAAESASGVGLGLALSRRLARQMGGDLRLARPEGQGACFVLTLPLA
jgi:signal transduction histidine kinase